MEIDNLVQNERKDKKDTNVDMKDVTKVSEFTPDLLAVYYDRLFPYELFAQWLSYNQGEDFLHKREFSFTLEGDQYIRYKAFRNAEDIKNALTKYQPYKIDLGAVFTVSPSDKGKVQEKEFTPIERELVFDVDLTDYDDIRTCCQGASICPKCWNFMIAAVKVIDIALRDDFGFDHVLWVYSGRRGIHCWVADDIARSLTNEARSAVVQYFTVVEGNENTKRKVVLKDPIHPFLERSYRILEPMFEKYIISENGQDILSKPDSWSKLLAMIPNEDIRNQLNEDWSSAGSDLSGLAKWNDVKKIVQQANTSKKRPKEDKQSSYALRTCIPEIVMSYLYPRLDANVSKQRNHLLKTPFAVHPKTGRVCVPIDPKQIEDFDPFNVPTLFSLDGEINTKNFTNPENVLDGPETSLDPYVSMFKDLFLDPLDRHLKNKCKDEREQKAAMNGDW